MTTEVQESRTRQAIRKQRDAGCERGLGQWGGPNAQGSINEALRLNAEAAALLTPIAAPTIRNGEVVRTADDSGPDWEIAKTLANPDQAAIDASIARTNLLLMPAADIVALAVDTAASIKADNSIEKMLAHQLAAIHVLTMSTAGRALEVEKRRGRYGEGFSVQDSVELGRLSNATARLSGAFQEGALALQRLKTGASQTVTVRHVTVQAGAQAVIGNVRAGANGASQPRRGKSKK